MNRMKILMLLERQFPFDERVEKEAVSLIEDGHEIYILSFNYDGLAKDEVYRGIHIVRFPITHRAYNKLSPLHRILPFYSRKWQKFVKQFLKGHKIDSVHVHDLPLANICYRIKRKTGCKLVLDQHELWSETVKHYRHYNTVIGKIVRYLSRWKTYEKKYFEQADMVITVETPIKEWYIENTGIDNQKVIVVPNTPPKSLLDGIDLTPTTNKDDFVLYYAGKIDVNRYLDSVIRALPQLKDLIPNIKFRIAGKIAKGCDPRPAANAAGVSAYVEYLGELSYEDMIRSMNDSDICICLLPSYSEELNRTIVTKLYQYIQLAKPVIVSRTDYMKRFVEKHGIGRAVNEKDPESIANVIAEMHRDKKFMEICSEHSLQIKDRYIWEKTVQPLIGFYREISE